MNAERHEVLLIEDNLLHAAPIRVFLHGSEFTMQHVTSLEDGLQAMRQHVPDVVLLDRSLPDSHGANTLRRVREEFEDVPVIMLTGAEGSEVEMESASLGAQDFLPKGRFDADGLKRSIRYAIERTDANRRLKNQAMLLDAASDAIMVTDLEHRIQYWNRRAEMLYGWNETEACRARTIDLFEPDSAHLTQATQIVRDNGQWNGDVEHRNRAGDRLTFHSRRTLVVDPDGKGSAILIINTDVTEKRNIEETVQRTQRIETVGALAAGVAHDFNNVLSPIIIGIQLLRPGCADPRQRKMLDKMKASADRGAQSVKDLLSFSKMKDGDPTLLEASDIMRKVARLCDGSFPRAVDVRCEITDDSAPVLADAAQLEHALMNLCLNSRDAMPEGGEVTLRTEIVEIPERYQATQLAAQPGPHAAFIVSDDGHGIVAENLEKIFQPYFTTKPPGGGSGNGLNAVLGVVKRAGGFVDVESLEGSGTTVSVCVPLAKTPAAPKHDRAAKPAKRVVAWD